MKKLLCSFLTAISICCMSFTSFADGWIQDNNGWKYFVNGAYTAPNTWHQISDSNNKLQWYYFDENSYMAHDKWIGDYYVGSTGEMLKDCVTPDGYFLDATGKWINWLESGTYVAAKGMNKYQYTIANANSTSILVNDVQFTRNSDQYTSYQTSGNGYTYTLMPITSQYFVFGVTKLSTFGITFYEFHKQ